MRPKQRGADHAWRYARLMASEAESSVLRDAVLQALDDAVAAIERHVYSRLESSEEARRAIDAALGAIYRSHNYLRETVPDYWTQADATLSGLKMQAVVYVRGRMEHAPVDAHETEFLVPGPGTVPSPDLYPTLNYYWKIWPEMKFDMVPPPHMPERSDKRPLVEKYVAGRLVVGTLRASIEHLRSVVASATN